MTVIDFLKKWLLKNLKHASKGLSILLCLSRDDYNSPCFKKYSVNALFTIQLASPNPIWLAGIFCSHMFVSGMSIMDMTTAIT